VMQQQVQLHQQCRQVLSAPPRPSSSRNLQCSYKLLQVVVQGCHLPGGALCCAAGCVDCAVLGLW
jgi:hypothetical protein